MHRTFAYLAVMILTLTSLALAQATVGTPRFGTYSGGPDIINLANLNMHLTVPIIHKPGRGIPFDYSLTYDTSIWYQNGSSWQPITDWGWRKQSDVAVGSAPYTVTVASYLDRYSGQRIYYNRYWYKVYKDRQGIGHGFNLVVSDDANSGIPETRTGTSSDGLFTMYVTSTPYAEVTPQMGGKIVPVLVNLNSPGTYKDANGNKITSSNNVFTDTLGQTVLSITGTAPAVTYTYKDSTGTSQNIIVGYTSMSVRTNFGCSGVAEYGPLNQYLVTSITYPNNTSYQFTYESTPGYSGSVTGRVASVTLPTGGVITYTYTGGNNGIRCENSTIAGLTRVVTGGTWTYTRTLLDTLNSTTTATDPDGNQNVITFHDIYSTQNQSSGMDQSTQTRTLVSTETRCYHSAGVTGCDPNVNQPITELDVTSKLANNQTRETDTFFNANGLTTQVDEYDFGNNARGPLLRRTTTTYATLTNGIIGRPSVVTVQNGAGGTVAQTTYSYDEYTVTATTGLPQKDAVSGSRGNVTSITRLLTGGTNPVSHIQYDDAGNALTITDPGGHTSTFGYDYTNLKGGFITQVTRAVTGSVSHVSSANYDINTGLKLSDTDENAKTTSYSYDSMLRPLVITRPDGGTTTYSYSDSSSPSVRVTTNITSTLNSDSYTQLDGYGRAVRQTNSNGEATPYDTVDTCYDNMGRVSKTSYPYQGGNPIGVPSCPISQPSDSYAYTFTGATAKVTVTHSDGTYATTEAYGRATRTTDEGNGTNRIQKVAQIDGLGRAASLCEVTANASGSDIPGACGQDIGATGFLTTYNYNTLGQLTGVTQGNRSPRTYIYDTLGRLTTVDTMESSTWSYTYDADGNVATRVRPAPNGAAGTVTTTYSYDALHRLTQITYSDSTPISRFYYDVFPSTWYTSVNAIGRLTRQDSGCGTSCSGSGYSYDVMGRVKEEIQWVEDGVTHTAYYTYNLDGSIATNTRPRGDVLTYTYNQGQRPVSVTTTYVSPNHPATLFSGANYNSFGEPLNYLLGASINNGVKTTNTYNALGQLTSKNAITNGGAGTLVSNFPNIQYAPNGNVTDDSDQQIQTYDDFGRILTSGQLPAPNTFEYDRYGNRTKQSGQNLSYDANNRIASGNGVTYDAVGNIIAETNPSYTYSYDAENRLISVSGSASETYVYDAVGRRVKRNYSGTSVSYYYDLEGHPVAMFGPSDQYWTGEMFLGNMHLATHSNGRTYFSHTNLVGSTRVTTDETGAVYNNCTWWPFGDQQSCTAWPVTDISYAGMERDQQTGLDHTWFRYYNSRLGRFMSADPLGGSIGDPQSLNRFAYVANDPTNAKDPLGLFSDAIMQPGTAAWFSQMFDASYNPRNNSDMFLPRSEQIREALGAYIGQVNQNFSDQGVQHFGGNVGSDPAFSVTTSQADGPFNQSITVYCSGGGFSWWCLPGADSWSIFANPGPVIVSADGSLGSGIFHQGNAPRLWSGASAVGNAALIGTAGVIGGTWAVGEIGTAGFMDVAVGNTADGSLHFAFGANGQWAHAWAAPEGMAISTRYAGQFAANAFRFSVPVLNPYTVIPAAGTAVGNCFTAVCGAFVRGWTH